MANALRELLAVFDIKVDEHELKEAAKHVDGFLNTLKKGGAILGEAFAVREVYEFVKSQVELAGRVEDTALRLGVSAQAIREWSFAAVDAGLDADTATMALGFLEKNLGEAALKGGESAKVFDALKVRFKGADGAARPLFEVIGDVADALSALPDQNQRAAYAMQLFGRQGRALLPILAQGRKGLEEVLAEARALGNGLGDDYYRAAKVASDQSERLGFALQSIKDRITSRILPGLTAFLGALKAGAKGVLEFTKVTYVLQTAATFLSVVLGVKLLRTVIALAKNFGLFKGSVLETIKSFTAFAAPYAAILALYLIFDDLFTLMKGGKSVIGDLLDELQGKGSAAAFAQNLRDTWEAVKDAVSSAADALGGLLSALEGQDATRSGGATALLKFFLDIIKTVTAATRLLAGFVKALAAIPEAVKSGSFDPVGKVIDQAGDAVFGKGGILGDFGNRFTANGLGVGQADPAIAGLPPEAVALWKAHEHERSTLGAGERYGKVRKGRNPNIESRPILPAQTVTLSSGGAAGAQGGVHVHQVNHTKVDVHTSSDQPRAVGEATGQGVATSHEKALNRAQIAANRK